MRNRHGSHCLRVGLDYRPALLTGAGIGRAVRELSRGLAEEPDLDLHLFGHSFSRARRSDPIPRGSRLHRLPIPGRSLQFFARCGLDAARLCGRVPLFHWTDYVHPPVTSARVVITVHDVAFAAAPEFHGGESQMLFDRCRTAVGRATRVICPTHATANDVREHFACSADRLTVIPFGCDHVREAAEYPPPLDESYVVAVGTIEPRKNHRVLLNAWRALPTPRPRLVVLGRRGWECEDIVADLQRSVAADGVIWHEALDDEGVFAHIAHATALVYPSRLEGFGFPPLEAMALGTPVVAGDTPALREVLGDAARFCDPASTENLTEELRSVLAGADLRRDLRAAGLRRAGAFTWSAAARAHAKVYREASE